MGRRNSHNWRSACIVVGLLGSILCTRSAQAEIKLHRLFSRDAVLQQKMIVPIFGTGDTEGETVTVRIQDQMATGVVKDGQWRVEIGPLNPGGPYQLNVTGGKLITLLDVMVGEVWVCAGGTNMQWNVLRSQGFADVVSHPINRQLRLYTLKREGAVEPRTTSETAWLSAGAASVGTFSAVGYFFGRALQPHVDVPIGLISCNHFDSTVESWISRDAIAASPEMKASLEKPIAAHLTRSPTVLFNAMVKPITQYGVRGVLWYQGETESEHAYEYRNKLKTLIADWRKHWGQPKMPFIIVQHAPFKVIVKKHLESKLAELRESQLLVSREVPNVSLVVITEYGDQYDMHPPQKLPVGERAALMARGAVYGERIEYSGPVFAGASFERNEATLRFEHVGEGLQAKSDELTGFVVAGSDRVFHEGKATILADTIVVTSAEVPVPIAVRYGWADFPTGNLMNKEGQPASPFRTDDFPLISAPKEE